jgi:hypothetical protein
MTRLVGYMPYAKRVENGRYFGVHAHSAAAHTMTVYITVPYDEIPLKMSMRFQYVVIALCLHIPLIDIYSTYS